MNDEPILTDFDGLIQNEHHQLLKAALPYLQPQGQRFISFLVKFQELRNTFSLFDDEENRLSACASGKRNQSQTEMLSDIRRFCSKKDQEKIDSILNFMNVYNIYSKYNSTMENNNRPGDNVEQLKSMLTPEQRNMFETYMSQLG